MWKPMSLGRRSVNCKTISVGNLLSANRQFISRWAWTRQPLMSHKLMRRPAQSSLVTLQTPNWNKWKVSSKCNWIILIAFKRRWCSIRSIKNCSRARAFKSKSCWRLTLMREFGQRLRIFPSWTLHRLEIWRSALCTSFRKILPDREVRSGAMPSS